MMYVVLAIFILGLLGGGVYFKDTQAEKGSVVLIAFIIVVSLAVMAGIRSPDIAPDYQNYIGWLEGVRNNNSFFDEIKDPLFVGLFLAVKELGFSDVLFFCLIAFLSLIFKYVFSRNIFDGKYCLGILFLILSRFYISHDFIQIRVGLAIGLSSVGLVFFYKARRALGSALYLAGIGMHMSVIIFSPIYIMLFFNIRHLSRRALACILLASVALSLLFPSSIEYLSNIGRLAPYLNGDYATSAIPLFSFYFMSRCIIVLLLLIFLFDQLQEIEKFVLFMSLLGVSVQLMLSWNDALSLRFAEVFGFFDMAMLFIMFRFLDSESKIIYGCGLLLMSAIYYYSSLKLVQDYAVSVS